MEAGFSGLRVSNGRVNDEFVPALKWPKQNAVYKEMAANDPIVGGMLFAIEMIIRKVTWDVKPANSSENAIKLAEFVESCRYDMEKSWPEMINDVLSFLQYGFCITEKVYKKRAGDLADPRYRSMFDDGLWGWRKFPMRAQDTIDRWQFADSGNSTEFQGNHAELLGAVQKDPNTYQEAFLPRSKFLLFRTNSRKETPEGASVLRQAYRPWYFKKTLEEIEAIGIERNLKGIPVVYAPAQYMSQDASPAQKSVLNNLQRIAAGLRANEQGSVVMPMAYDERGNKLFSIDLLGSNQTAGGSYDVDKVINRYSTAIAQTVLADFIMLGNQGVGSYALSNNKVKMFHAAISAWLDNIADVFNKDAIPELIRINGFDMKDCPKLVYGTIDNYSIEEVTDFFSKLTDSGFLEPTESLRDWVLARVDAPSVGGDRLESVEERVAQIKTEGLLSVEDKKSAVKLAEAELTQDTGETEPNV